MPFSKNNVDEFYRIVETGYLNHMRIIIAKQREKKAFIYVKQNEYADALTAIESIKQVCFNRSNNNANKMKKKQNKITLGKYKRYQIA